MGPPVLIAAHWLKKNSISSVHSTALPKFIRETQENERMTNRFGEPQQPRNSARLFACLGVQGACQRSVIKQFRLGSC